MTKHRMVGREIQFAADDGKDRTKPHASELHALLPLLKVEAVQPAHEVVMPERAARLAISDDRHANGFLHAHKLGDGLIFNVRQLFDRQAVLLEMAFSGLLYRIGPKKTADMVGAWNEFLGGHADCLSFKQEQIQCHQSNEGCKPLAGRNVAARARRTSCPLL